MTIKKTLLGLLALALIAAAWFAVNFNPAGLAASQQKKNDTHIAEQMAYHVGTLAYVYGYPFVDMYLLSAVPHNRMLVQPLAPTAFEALRPRV